MCILWASFWTVTEFAADIICSGHGLRARLRARVFRSDMGKQEEK